MARIRAVLHVLLLRGELLHVVATSLENVPLQKQERAANKQTKVSKQPLLAQKEWEIPSLNRESLDKTCQVFRTPPTSNSHLDLDEDRPPVGGAVELIFHLAVDEPKEEEEAETGTNHQPRYELQTKDLHETATALSRLPFSAPQPPTRTTS